jgi:hypothetical protein
MTTAIKRAKLNGSAHGKDPNDLQGHPEVVVDALRQAKGDPAGEAIMQPISARELFAMEFGEMVWNIQDILPAGTTLAFGKPKKGKSFLVLMIAISIAANRPVFGRRPVGCRVLYLGLEDSKRRLQRRAKGCAASLGIDPASSSTGCTWTPNAPGSTPACWMSCAPG